MITPYLRFEGNCEEAFKFYADCFGGKIEYLSRLNNDPDNPVMHAQVTLTESGGSVSGSDGMKPDWHKPSIEIIVHLPTRERVEEVLNKLSKGASEVTGFKPHPPPDDGGGSAAVVDKYGYTWFLCA
jgi:PhnB protein